MSRFAYAAKVAEKVSAWDVWNLDVPTWGWIIFIVFFAAWEIYTWPGQQLTNHLRPVFNQFDLAWFLTFGLWLWMGWHFLVDGVDFKAIFNIGLH